jgi:hypothetical protein
MNSVIECELARTSKKTQAIISKVISSCNQGSLEAVFMTRVMEGFLEIAASSNLAELVMPDSNCDVLMAVLQTPEALSLFSRKDPLAKAKLRGLEIKQKFLEIEGGCQGSKEIAQLLGVTPQAINQRRQRGKLIGLPRGKGKYIYPLWQFTDEGKTIVGLEKVLDQLAGIDPWIQVAFFLNPNLRLNHQSPLVLLRRGEVESVVNSAIAFAHDKPD